MKSVLIPEDAIRASYRPLLKDGTVEEVYVQAVIDCVNKYGPVHRYCTGYCNASFY